MQGCVKPLLRGGGSEIHSLASLNLNGITAQHHPMPNRIAFPVQGELLLKGQSRQFSKTVK